MCDFRRMIFVCVFLLLTSSIVLTKLLFGIKFWNIQLPVELRLNSFAGISLKDCIMACGKRNTDSHCFCKEGQFCHNWTCKYEECAKPETPMNGGFVGNKYDIGSILKIMCDPNFTEVNSRLTTECAISGNWSYNPTCRSLLDCGEITVANGDLVGSDNHFGAVKTIVCNDGYTERIREIFVRCESSGNWNYTPSCEFVCLENDSYTSQNFQIRVVHSRGIKKKYTDAWDNCLADGGSLVKINETWKMTFVSEVLLSCSSYKIHDFWTDGKVVNGVWLFSDGSHVPMDMNTFWHDYDTVGNSDKCTRLNKENGNYRWADKQCQDKLRFICEY